MMDVSALHATLLALYMTMIVGCMFVRCGVLGANDSKGIRTLLMYVLTPAMLIKCVLDIRVGDVLWTFVAVLFVGKVTVFVVVALTTFHISNDAAKAGLYAMLVTQSNDMALGLPLVNALYPKESYEQYIYLVIPITLLLNTIGFTLIEAQRHLEDEHSPPLARSLIGQLTRNPILVSMLIGCVASVFHADLPRWTVSTMNEWAGTFSVVALFSLGESIGSEWGEVATYNIVTPVLLVLVKGLLLPLFLHAIASIVVPDSPQLISFAFLYGSLPPAPTVFVYAVYANVAISQVSRGVALGTVLAGPWLLVTASTIAGGERVGGGDAVSQIVSMVTAVLCVITLGSIWLNARHREKSAMPKTMIVVYIGLLLTFAITAPFTNNTKTILTLNNTNITMSLPHHSIFTFVHNFAEYGECLCWLWMSYAMYSIRTISICYVHTTASRVAQVLIVAALVLTAVAVVLGETAHNLADIFMYSTTVVVCTILLLRQKVKLPDHEVEMSDVEWDGDHPADPSPTNVADTDKLIVNEATDDIEDMLCSKQSRCTNRSSCRLLIERESLGRHSTNAIIVIVSCACVTTVLRIFVLVWRVLGKDNSSGVYRQLSMLSSLAAHSHAFIAWACISAPFSTLREELERRWRVHRHGTAKLALPRTLDPRTRAVCQSFTTNHRARAELDLLPCHSITGRRRRAFTGSSLVDWLLEQCLAESRGEAVKVRFTEKQLFLQLGQRLVLGHIIAHVREEEQLSDSSSLFVFTPTTVIH